MSRKSAMESVAFLEMVHVAPRDQKSWQIAGALMTNSPLRDLPRDKFREACERLSAAVDAEVPTLRWPAGREPWELGQTPQSMHRLATGRLLSALEKIEKDMAPAAASPERDHEQIFDSRVGTAPPGGTSVSQGSGDGAAWGTQSTASKRDRGHSVG
jgi:hypothetical protein